jgi:CspA family cold shock protein
MVSPLQFNNNFNYNIMSNGTVKFFNESKGFGFITEEGVDKDHFVHISGLIDEIREGDSVEFDLQEGKKGLNAVNVKVI